MLKELEAVLDRLKGRSSRREVWEILLRQSVRIIEQGAACFLPMVDPESTYLQ